MEHYSFVNLTYYFLSFVDVGLDFSFSESANQRITNVPLCEGKRKNGCGAELAKFTL